MEKKDVRVQLVISQGEIDALDEWRAANKIWSRSEAIRQAILHLIGDAKVPAKPERPAPVAVPTLQRKAFNPQPKGGKRK